MTEVDIRGTHRTHCCIVHGCKYGDNSCPVVSGEVKQAYDCEVGSDLNESCDPQHDHKEAARRAAEAFPESEWTTTAVLLAVRGAFISGYLAAAQDIRGGRNG